MYQENGNLFPFADFFDDKSILLADTPETALIQVLRYLSPVTVVDESHNAGSTLSVAMLNNLNPSFILELTATAPEHQQYHFLCGRTGIEKREHGQAACGCV